MTATLENQAPLETAPVEPRRHRVTVPEYRRMIESGVFGDQPRIELLDGELIEMSAMSPRHFKRVQRLHQRLERSFGQRVDVASQGPISLPGDGEPEPDVFLYRNDLPEDDLAAPADLLLVIEVSDTTLAYDRAAKLRAYARDGITEYWIVNLVDDQLEVYRDPQGERYATSFTLKAGTPATCLAFPDEPIDWS